MKSTTLTLLSSLAFALAADATTHAVLPGKSIQAKINLAVAGDIVAIFGGTYNEDLTINKAIRLVEVSGQQVILNGNIAFSGIVDCPPLDGFAVSSSGRGITLTNTTRTAVNVDVSATGWSARAGVVGDLLLPIEPETTLDTAQAADSVGAAERSAPAGMKVKGVGSIPKTYVGGVIARVTLTGGAVATSLSLWPVSQGKDIMPTLSAGAGETRTGLVLLPVSPAGGIRWFTSQPDAQVTVRVVGVLRSLPPIVAPRAALQS